MREKAFRSFLAAGLPGKKDEAWKYTSLSDFKGIEWSLPSENEAVLTHEQMREEIGRASCRERVWRYV